MQATLIFDFTYYALAIAMVVILLAGAILGFKSRGGDRKSSLGMGLASLGALITITETVPLLALSRSGSINGFLYQQAQFSIAYLGFAIFLVGLDKVLVSRMFIGASLKRARIFSWGAYFVSIALSSLFLFNTNSYKVMIVGSQVHVAQQLVFWLPLFIALLEGATVSILAIIKSDSLQLRNYARWFGLTSALVLVGALRESTVIPFAGDSFTDLLVAFVPFLAGSVCILMGTRSTLASTNNEKASVLNKQIS